MYTEGLGTAGELGSPSESLPRGLLHELNSVVPPGRWGPGAAPVKTGRIVCSPSRGQRSVRSAPSEVCPRNESVGVPAPHGGFSILGKVAHYVWGVWKA